MEKFCEAAELKDLVDIAEVLSLETVKLRLQIRRLRKLLAGQEGSEAARVLLAFENIDALLGRATRDFDRRLLEVWKETGSCREPSGTVIFFDKKFRRS